MVNLTARSNAPRQPMFWAAHVFSLGLWIGLRAWRPPAWWAVAITVFVFSACWFVSRRTWLARTLALATWFLLGAFLIQIRSRDPEDPYLVYFTDGQSITLTAHVIRAGYVAIQKKLSFPMDCHALCARNDEK